MKFFRKHLLLICSALLISLSAQALDSYDASLFATVTDAGEVVDRLVIDFGKGAKVKSVDTETFSVKAIASTEDVREGTDVTSYGDYEISRKIEKVSVKKNVVTLYFNQAEGATLAYLSAARNYPAELTYTVEQNKPISIKRGREKNESYTAEYKCDNKVTDSETESFKSVIVEGGINYQLFEPKKKSNTLIVWFHGNGEGDWKHSNNNVAQIRANRGAVAWATKEAQDIFKGAYVMAFQAPDTWYYANRDSLLEQAEKEIQDIVKKYGIDKKRIVLSGCSAGGYMSTRMIIKYPDLFSAAMINCPALDIADARGGETPTDEELASIRNSRTAIYLVQGENDSSVDTENCSKRLFKALADGKETSSQKFEQDFDSDFTTTQTADKKYVLSLYDTTDSDRTKAKLQFAEDYNLDGVTDTVEYSNHWSWIYTLRNNPKTADNVSIWQWAASRLK
ncbi:MAG: prolyl oligopeptidase family serine peptidase [Treponema sp.]|nr:prolyl oligopeptidase family serine peptidase [Treponema sp.]